MDWQKSIFALGIRDIILCPAVVILFGLPLHLPLQSHPESKGLKFPPTVSRPDVHPRTPGAGTRWIEPKPLGGGGLSYPSGEGTLAPSSTSPGWSGQDGATVPGDTSAPAPPSGSTSYPAPPPGRGEGGRAEPSCNQQSKIPLTVLMPTSNVGTTVAANPTFFWYVPKTTAETAEFVIVDNNRNDVYRTTFALSGTPGVVQLHLPATVSLKVGKNYLWQFEIICNPLNRQTKDKKYVQGLVQRVEMKPTLKTQLDYATTPLQKAKLYAEAGIWHESLTILAQVRSYRPTEWEELLKSVGLDAVALAPFVKCCTVEN